MKRFFGIFMFLMLVPKIAQASSFLRVCTATGNCGLCDIIAQAILLGKWLITGASGLALFIIIWAGFQMITSSGDSEKISAAKKQIIGAVLGIVIVMFAFQLTVIIITMFATPAKYESFKTTNSDSNENKEAEKQGSLTRFLGVAWWSICNEKDLREQNGRTPSNKVSTADCKYWGDGTPCSKNREKICYKGKCENEVTFNKDTDNEITIHNACEFLAHFDKTYQESEDKDTNKHEAYKCQNISNCYTAIPIEKGLCPGNSDNVCCAEKKQ